jgi:hypothetical protein
MVSFVAEGDKVSRSAGGNCCKPRIVGLPPQVSGLTVIRPLRSFMDVRVSDHGHNLLPAMHLSSPQTLARDSRNAERAFQGCSIPFPGGGGGLIGAGQKVHEQSIGIRG